MKFAKKTDMLIIASIVLFCVVFWLVYRGVYAKPGKYAEIYHNSQQVKKVELQSGSEYVFSVPQSPEVVFRVYSDGSIAFLSSDCPDKVCIRAGRLSRAGQYAACLPNRLYIKIVSGDGDPGEADIIIG
ncbi:MAG: NusG domain II-containing protein [Clostridiales bacterium]|nr:NusG domain II-containing protein [Clostridiales bacterium]